MTQSFEAKPNREERRRITSGGTLKLPGGTQVLDPLYEYYNTGDDDSIDFYSFYWAAQTFTPSVAHTITSVKLKLYRVQYPGTITVSIRATDGSGHPTGSDLCSGTIDGNTLTPNSAGAWYEITLGSGCALSANTKYAIVVRAPSGSSTSYGNWRRDYSSPTYAGGCMEYSSDSGSTWGSYTNVDFMFEEWGIGWRKFLLDADVRAFTRGWTSGKFLKGAGVDTDPTEVDILGEFGFVPVLHEWQLDFSPWTATVTGSGSTTKGYGMCKASSGATANSTARLTGYKFGWIVWSSFPIIVYCDICARNSVSTAQRWYKIDIGSAANPTAQAIGWRLDNLALKGIVHNGTSLYVTDLATTLTSGTDYKCYMVFNPGSYIKWYIDGNFKGQDNDPSHLPSTLRQEDHYVVLAITNGATAADCSLEIWNQGWRRQV